MRPRREALLVAAVLLLIAATPAHATFGVSLTAAVSDNASNPVTQAGAHPYQGVTDIAFSGNESVSDIRVDLPPGLISNPQATPRCTAAQFPSCPKETQVGTEHLTAGVGPVPVSYTAAVYNIVRRTED